MRLRVCKHCKTQFRPGRADSDFCRSLCRQAAYRLRKKGDEFEDAARRAQRITDAAALVAEAFDAYRREAARLHMQAEERGIKDVKFMGTPRGILAVEKIPGALKLAVARCDWPGGGTLSAMIETEGYSKSPEVLAIIPKQSNLGGPFIERIAEKECRDLLCGPERKVSLFSGHIDEEGYVWLPLGSKPEAGLSAPQYPHDWDDELDLERDDSGFDGQAADLLAGGGYHVE